MKARLDGIYSPDLPSGHGELPPDPGNCWIVVQADIGSDTGRGADCFTMYVTTPKFLEGSVDVGAHQLGRGLMIVSQFDWNVIEEAVSLVCASVQADTWGEVAATLSKYFIYEYE